VSVSRHSSDSVANATSDSSATSAPIWICSIPAEVFRLCLLPRPFLRRLFRCRRLRKLLRRRGALVERLLQLADRLAEGFAEVLELSGTEEIRAMARTRIRCVGWKRPSNMTAPWGPREWLTIARRCLERCPAYARDASATRPASSGPPFDATGVEGRYRPARAQATSRGRYAYFLSSSRATMPRWTSSGPSARRSTRAMAIRRLSSGSATPSPPWI
jgi:hypothetical protein